MTWFIPSRARPHNLARLIAACRATGMTTPVVVRIDGDEHLRGVYADLCRDAGWELEVGPRERLSVLYNEFFGMRPDLRWYGFLSDDVVPETPAWDRRLIDAAGADGLAFGDDGINGALHAAHFVLGGDLVREIGWLSLPGLDRIYIDTCWNDIARDRGAFRYLPDVKLYHRHFSNHQALFDATYKKQNKAADRALYEAWRDRGIISRETSTARKAVSCP